ncbi:hypothetical protein Salat_2349300 [Sesamum alatum]|uniref:Uncharacterized protein n=1 Tax=Sesamum alatum TaxID=300844 RepID=A0AAE1XWQ3_9LAMI|nr:hypothetical protein Salat_2349300 [Sesamum alatum]
MALVASGPNEQKPIEIAQNEDEDDEDLFEINLEIVNKIPPPHYWESYFTATTNTVLLANCLLPVADVSSAVPMVMRACDALLAWPGVTGEGQPQPHGSSQGAGFVLQYKEMKV